MIQFLRKLLVVGRNEHARRAWLARTLAAVPAKTRILDAGAGELGNRPLCAHLDYVSQDFCQYEGQGDGQGLQLPIGFGWAVDVRGIWLVFSGPVGVFGRCYTNRPVPAHIMISVCVGCDRGGSRTSARKGQYRN